MSTIIDLVNTDNGATSMATINTNFDNLNTDKLEVADITGKAPLASPTFTGTVTVPTPSNATDASTKAYVDAVAQGLSVKQSVILTTAAALPTNTYLAGVITITATGTLTVDGTVTALNDRILVKDEVAALGNGIYKVTTAGAIGVAAVLTRSTDMDIAAEFPGAFVFVEIGTVNAAAGFVCTNSVTPTVGTTAINFTQFSGAGEITAGAGMTKTGNTLDVIGTANRITVGADAIDIGTDVVTLTGTQTLTNKTIDGVTPTTMGYVDPTSSIQTQLNGKQASGSYLTTVDISANTNLAVTAPVVLTGDTISIPAATASVNGYATSTQITKLDGIAASATANVKASSAEIDTGTDDAKFATALAISGSHNVPHVIPSTSGNVLTSNGTDWTSAAPAGDATKLPLAGGTMTGPIVQGSYTNLSLPASDHTLVGTATNAILSGATVAQSNLVFLGTGGKWLLVDSDAIATCKGLLGIAMEAKNDTQAMLVALPGSFVRDDTWNWTIGDILYAGETAGGIQNTIPTGGDGVIIPIGVAITADIIYFNPSLENSTVVA